MIDYVGAVSEVPSEHLSSSINAFLARGQVLESAKTCRFITW